MQYVYEWRWANNHCIVDYIHTRDFLSILQRFNRLSAGSYSLPVGGDPTSGAAPELSTLSSNSPLESPVACQRYTNHRAT